MNRIDLKPDCCWRLAWHVLSGVGFYVAATVFATDGWGQTLDAGATMRRSATSGFVAPTDSGLARFAIGQPLTLPGVGVAAYSRGGLTETAPPSPLVSGNYGGFAWALGVATLPTGLVVDRPIGGSPGPDSAYLGRLSVGYAWGPIQVSGSGSLVRGGSVDGWSGLSGTYLAGGADFNIPFSLTLGTRIGYLSRSAGDSRNQAGGDSLDWSIGLSREVLGFGLTIQYSGIGEISHDQCQRMLTCGSRFSFSIGKQF